MPGANLARGRGNLDPRRFKPLLVVPLQRLAVGVAQQAGAIRNLRGNLLARPDCLVLRYGVNQRRNAAWSAGSVSRRKSGVPSRTGPSTAAVEKW